MKTLFEECGKRAVAVILAALALACASSLASAQATRTWVSGVGDDVNPCSRTAPCKTWAGAISKTAAGGEIDALDPAGFGALNITKSITIDGGAGQVGGILGAAINGVIINAAATDKVIIRNVSINGVRHSSLPGIRGISVLNAAQVFIDNVEVIGFATAGISVAPSTANPVSVMIERSRLIDNAVGLSVNATNAAATARLSNTTVQQNDTGLAVVAGGSIISFNNNRLNGNGTDGAPTQTVYQR